MRVRFGFILVCLLALLPGCRLPGSKAVGGRYVWKDTGLQFSLADGRWHVREVDEDSLLFRHTDGPGHFMARLSFPIAEAAVPGDVLVRSLFVHFERKKIVDHSRRRILGREADCLLVAATVGNDPVTVRVCTLRLGEGVLDLACWSAPEHFGAADVRFNEFLAGIGPQGGR